jgi:hypothetical protein
MRPQSERKTKPSAPLKLREGVATLPGKSLKSYEMKQEADMCVDQVSNIHGDPKISFVSEMGFAEAIPNSIYGVCRLRDYVEHFSRILFIFCL